jgi:hypothetical protein
LRSKVVVIGVGLMVIGVAMIVSVLAILNDGGSETSLFDVDINQDDTLWAFRAMLLAITLLVCGSIAIGLGLILRPVDGRTLDGYYVEERRAFDVEEAKRTKGVEGNAPYARKHVEVGTVVIFCKACGYANLPEDDRCNDCGRHLVLGDRPW